ncbi:P-loop containing nucleoside triphosphate hydrolase protein [Hyaloscypha sp. PMI_1271]|nr:P-loop containing nucleoside triphosphate hydrolase protein [Hyaloscypha sp. PMI_1271]
MTEHPPVDSRNYIPSYPLTSVMPVKTVVQRTTLRGQIHEQLHRSLGEEMKGETRKVGVWGLGGAGKSQLVRSYLGHYRADYDATFWIEAGQTTSIDRDFLQIYHSLAKAQPQNKPPSSEEVLRTVHSWFIGRGGRWLFVFDGADQLENESDVHFVDISRYVPESPNVHVIITSRSYIAKILSTFEGVNVGELEELQAEELFFKCSEITMTQQKVVDQAKIIVKELGYLALAITLAGSYISQTPRLSSNLPAYLKEYHRRRQEVLSEQPNKRIHQYGESVMTVWEMSYAAVENQLPEAGRFLTLLAFLNHEDIFLDLFGLDTNGASPPLQRSWTSVIWNQNKVSIHMIEKCFAVLEKHSLLQRQENRATYSMHKLVHAWGSDRLLQKEKWDGANVFCTGAFQLLFEAVLNCVKTPEAKLRLVPHLRENFDAIQKPGRVIGIDSFTDELEYIGDFLSNAGQWQDAGAVQRKVLDDRQRILGEEHPDTISAMNDLANALGNQGQLDEAAKMHEEVLEKRRRILGKEHPSTISAMNNLANTLGDQGQLDEAAKMLEEVLEKMRRILGEEHPSTISVMNNLAFMLGGQGQLDEAAKMHEEVLEKRRRILGEEHPDTISAMNNLANTLGNQGQLDEAAKMLEGVLEKRRRILGEEHPDTISAMNNLANTLGDQGQLDKAISLLEVTVQKMKLVHGDEHPHTKVAISNLTRLTSSRATNKPIDGDKERDKGSTLYTRIKRRFRRKAL